MRAAIVIAALAIIAGSRVTGQQAAFDVVSIKPSQPGAQNRLPRISPGRVEIYNTTLKGLIRMTHSRFAFDSREIAGGPSWIDSERFDLIGTMNLPPQVDSAGLPAGLVAMLRSLVEERFRLKTHNERRQGNVYTLTFARGDKKTGAGLRPAPDLCAVSMKQLTGPKAPPPRSGPPACSFGGPPGKLIGTGVTMGMFSNVLSSNVGRTVIDQTALGGNFDIELTFDPASAAQAPPGAPLGPIPTDDSKPSIFTALQEQLGLKLESTRSTIDVLVVDHAEHPSPN